VSESLRFEDLVLRCHDSLEELPDLINAWAKAKRIGEFFADVERQANMDGDQKAVALGRLALARTVVDTAEACVMENSEGAKLVRVLLAGDFKICSMSAP